MTQGPGMHQIKASAGSGKTYRLTQRFLELLSACGEGPRTAACTSRAREIPDDTPADWRGIMAITFTNAAATEMLERVLRELKERALSGDPRAPATRSAKAWIERILHDMGSLNISTIDSLLNLILRLSALSRNLPPDFTTVFTTEEILEPCLDDLMNRAWEGDEKLQGLVGSICRSAVEHEDWNGFRARNTIATRLKEVLALGFRGELAGLTDPDTIQDTAGTGRGLRPKLLRRIHERLRLLRSRGLPATGERAQGDPAPLAYEKRFVDALDKALAAFAMPPADVEGPKTLADYARLRPDPGTDLKSAYFEEGHKFPVLKKDMDRVDGALADAYAALARDIAGYRCLEHLYRQGRIYRPLLELAGIVLDRYERDIEFTGKVPNDLIPGLVQDILATEDGVNEAFCRLGNRLRHFLVDEFQDTSRGHWQALQPLVANALASGGSLTWVGDVKQAIYGFRGGDCTLFDEVATDRELADIVQESGVEKESLAFNWRSSAAVISFNNDLFSPLHDRDIAEEALLACLSEDVAKRAQGLPCSLVPGLAGTAEGEGGPGTLAGHFAAMTAQAYEGAAQEQAPRNDGMPGRVRLLRVPARAASGAPRAGDGAGMEGEGDDAPMEKAILDAVRLEGARDTDRESGPRWNRILVLVRSNAEAMAAARVLSREAIPVITENSLLLGEHPLVVQTLALLRFLRAPDDDIAFWTLVTGSILRHGLTPEERAILDDRLVGMGRDPRRLAPDGDGGKALWKIWKEECPQACERQLDPFVGRAGSMTPYDIVAEWYEHEDAIGRFPDAAPFLRRFLELLDTCQHRDIRSLPDFLDYWDLHGNEEKVPMPRGMNAVRIMTVHAAKGLQAPVVIVTWKSRRPGHEPLEVMEYLHGDGKRRIPLRVLCRGKTIFPATVARRLREAFEAVNRLYVACTRAQESLLILEEQAARGEGRMLDVLWEHSANTLGIEPEEAAVLATERERLCAAGEASGDNSPRPASPEETAPGEGAATAAGRPGEGNGLPGPGSGDGAQQGPEEPWTPMAWVPGLHVHLSHQDESSPRDLAKDRGTFLHACMEALSALPAAARDAGQIVEAQFAKRPWLRDGDFAETARGELEWFLSLPDARRWLDEGLPEQSMVHAGGNGMETLRVDLLVPEADGVLVLDYKHGDPDSRTCRFYERKMHDYLACLAACGQPNPRGLILYLSRRECCEIVPGRRPVTTRPGPARTDAGR